MAPRPPPLATPGSPGRHLPHLPHLPLRPHLPLACLPPAPSSARPPPHAVSWGPRPAGSRLPSTISGGPSSAAAGSDGAGDATATNGGGRAGTCTGSVRSRSTSVGQLAVGLAAQLLAHQDGVRAGEAQRPHAVAHRVEHAHQPQRHARVVAVVRGQPAPPLHRRQRRRPPPRRQGERLQRLRVGAGQAAPARPRPSARTRGRRTRRSRPGAALRRCAHASSGRSAATAASKSSTSHPITAGFSAISSPTASEHARPPGPCAARTAPRTGCGGRPRAEFSGQR
jgi:hypothetical protein